VCLLEAIAAIGIAATLRRVRGMYAIAAFDTHNETLWMARDPFGIKPMCFGTSPNGKVAFGSDSRSIAQILVDDGGKVTPNRDSIAHFLIFGFMPRNTSVWSEIQMIEPGHLVRIDQTNCTTTEFSSVPLPCSDGSGITPSELLNSLYESVNRHLLADVPVGIFLSSGVDSSSIAALALRTRPLRSFSISWNSANAGESIAAAGFAQSLGLEHTTVRFSDFDLTELVRTSARAFPEPFGDSASLPLLVLSQRASEEVKVVLTGEGGDEMFGGYRRYWAFHYSRAAGRLSPRTMLSRMASIERIPRRARQLAAAASAPSSAIANAQFLSALPLHLASSIFPGSDPALLERITSPYDLPGRNSPENVAATDIRSHLAPAYLEKIDRTSMFFGLEARVPFLDLDLAEAASRLTPKQFMSRTKTKPALKNSLTGTLPDSILTQRKKGFDAPVHQWMRASRDLIDDAIHGRAAAAGFIDSGVLESFAGRLRSPGGEAFGGLVYNAIALEMWLQSLSDDGLW
jgi:asparagine synthase (glutamine-hydrolysing)